MYTITHNGNLLFDPRIQGYPIKKPWLVQEANKLATLTFTIYPDHPEYDNIDPLTSVIAVYLDGTLILKARPTYRKRTMRGGIEWKCEELIAKLNDFCVRPFSVTKTVSQFVDYVLASYNARVASADQITKGNVYVSTADAEEYTLNQCYGHWDTLVTMLAAKYGGYLRPRYEANGIYLDYLREEDLSLNSQTVEFGKNMADIFLETDASKAFSVLVPQGSTTQSTVNNVTVLRYVDISSVNSGLDYLESATGIALFGRREAVQYWNDISDPSELKTKAQAYLDENAVKFEESVELTAADLHHLNVNVPAFQFLQRVKAESEFHDLSHIYPIEKLEIPLGDPEDADIALGKPPEELSDRIASEEKQLKGNSDEFRFIVEGAGLYINKNGVWAFSQNQNTGLGAQFAVEEGKITSLTTKTGVNSLGSNETLYSLISQNAQQIALKVSAGSVATQLAVEVGNVTITGGNLIVDGMITSSSLAAAIAALQSLTVNGNASFQGPFSVGASTAYFGGDTSIVGALTSGNGAVVANSNGVQSPALYIGNDYGLYSNGIVEVSGVKIGGDTATWRTKTVVTGVATTGYKYFKTSDDSLEYGKLVQNVYTDTIYYLGRTPT